MSQPAEEIVLDVLRKFHWRANDSLLRELEERYGVPFEESIKALQSLQRCGLIEHTRTVMIGFRLKVKP